ncbi:hypothetical protein [Kitasatospora cineracea]|uniref:hypothetical protein n=1 Tax=Kitasatospora cineracea TaxID=88074 RepID=UPI0036894343
MPTITITVGARQYRHLWLKYITGADLSRHCAVSLHGRYSRAVDETITTVTVDLNEFPHAIAWYLCGVTKPYRWEDNPHLALEAAPGHTQTLAVQDLTVHLDGVRPIPITNEHIPNDDPRAAVAVFGTCRNWWFANYLVHVRGVPDVHGDRPRVTTLRPGNGQEGLIPTPERRPRPAAPPPAPVGEPRQTAHQPPIDAVEQQVATSTPAPPTSRTRRTRP